MTTESFRMPVNSHDIVQGSCYSPIRSCSRLQMIDSSLTWFLCSGSGFLNANDEGKYMKLYHTGKEEIRCPDIRRGRKNADFGQGFYLTPDKDFSYRWAGEDAVINEYELDVSGLLIHRFNRDEEWFHYIFQNRRSRDHLSADIVIGPIANDTIFETFGMISSGFLKPADALKLLMVGPEYTQVAVKTEKAASQIRWIRSCKIAGMEPSHRKAEQEAYDISFAQILHEIVGEK